MNRLALLVSLTLAATTARAEFELSPPAVGQELGAEPVAVVTNGDGFLAVFRRHHLNRGHAAMPLDSNGRRTRESAVFISDEFGSVGRAGDNYVVSSIEPPGIVRLTELAPDGTPLREWNTTGIARAHYQVTSTTDGGLVLLSSTQIGRAYLFRSDGTFLREVSWHTDPRSLVAAGKDRFVVMTGTPSSIVLLTVTADGTAAPVVEINRAEIGAPAAVLPFALDAGTLLVLLPLAAPDAPLTPGARSVFVSRSGALSAVRRLEAFDALQVISPALVAYEGGALLVAVTGTAMAGSTPSWRAIRFDAAGNPIDADAVLLPDVPTAGGSVGSNGSTVVIYSGSTSVSFRNIDEILHRETIPLTRRTQLEPEVTAGGTESLVVWREPTATGDTLKARLVSPNAAVGNELVIARTDGLFGEHAVAYGGRIYLVVWHHWQQLYGVRITMSGEILDREPILIRDGAGQNAQIVAASDGTNFLVVWFEQGIKGASISAAGGVGAAHEFVAWSASQSPSRPDVAWDGQSYVLVWTSVWNTFFPGPPPTSDVRAMRVSRDAAPLSGPVTITTGLVHPIAPKIASGRSTSFVTFGAQDLRAIHLSGPSLTPGTPFMLALTHGSSAKPQFDGRDFAVAWRDRTGHYHYLGRIAPGETAVRRSRVAARPRREPFPYPVEVVVTPDGTAAIVAQEWRAYDPEAPTWRIMVYPQNEIQPDIRRRSAGR